MCLPPNGMHWNVCLTGLTERPQRLGLCQPGYANSSGRSAYGMNADAKSATFNSALVRARALDRGFAALPLCGPHPHQARRAGSHVEFNRTERRLALCSPPPDVRALSSNSTRSVHWPDELQTSPSDLPSTFVRASRRCMILTADSSRRCAGWPTGGRWAVSWLDSCGLRLREAASGRANRHSCDHQPRRSAGIKRRVSERRASGHQSYSSGLLSLSITTLVQPPSFPTLNSNHVLLSRRHLRSRGSPHSCGRHPPGCARWAALLLHGPYPVLQPA